MEEATIKVASGSISTDVDGNNFKEDKSRPENLYGLAIDCDTKHLKEYKGIGIPNVSTITLPYFGMGGVTYRTRLLEQTLKPKIEEKLLRTEEIANEHGQKIKFVYSNLFGTGTSSTISPLIWNTCKSLGLNNITFAVIPNLLSEGYQKSNFLYALSLLSFQPTILVTEDFAELTSTETRIKAQNVAGMKPSKYYFDSTFYWDFCCNFTRVISGKPVNNNIDNSNDDDLDFLDSYESNCRNNSVEIENALGGRAELFCLYYNHSVENDFQKLAILKPTVQPKNPQDPIIFAVFNANNISEDQVSNEVTTSLELQGLRPERIFFLPSQTNELIALIPSAIPNRIQNLINQVRRKKPLQEVLTTVAKKSLLSSIPPICIGNEKRVVKEGLEKIFFSEKSNVEEYVKSLGLSMSWDELIDRNLFVNLAEKQGCFIRPVGDVQ